MQKFILLMLILGLAFFLYLLKTNQINQKDFSIKRLQGDTEFEIRKNTTDSAVKSSDIYVIIKDREYKIFTFSGNDFSKLLKAEYPQVIYKVPLDAIDAISGTWIGNRYVFYILQKENKETGNKVYEVYKTEYSTDDASKLEYYLIKSVEDSELSNKTEVTY